MRLFLELLIAAALIFAVTILWRESRRRLLSPVKPPRGAGVFTVVTFSGNGEGLEQLVTELLWLHNTAGLRPRIILEDCGLDSDGIAIARLLERDGKVTVVAKSHARAVKATRTDFT